jgi:hypothetical protein
MQRDRLSKDSEVNELLIFEIPAGLSEDGSPLRKRYRIF